MHPKPSEQPFDGGSLKHLRRDLENPDRDVRVMAISKLLFLRPPDDVIVELLEKPLADPDAQVRVMACRVLSSINPPLSAQQSRESDAKVQQSPLPQNSDDISLARRCALVVSYFNSCDETTLGSPERRQHILWLIKNEPELSICGSPDCFIDPSLDSEGYQATKEIWLSHLESDGDNLAILANAASFFQLYDREIAEKLLLQARTLQPDEPRWHNALARLYSLHAEDGQVEVAAKSLASLREAERVSEQDPEVNHMRRVHALVQLSKAALAAFEFTAANNYALELLDLTSSDKIPEYFRNGGNAVYYSNMVLGCVAFERGEIESAKSHLLASGNTKGSPQLNSFGPNMTLAKALLESDHRDVVLEFFQQCEKFWESGSDRLKEWATEVEQGGVPDFGANLKY